MKELLAAVLCMLLTLMHLSAQNKTVLLEPQNRKINQGEPLPTQTSFDIQVPVNEATGIIMINVFKGNNTADVIERTFWARPVNFNGEFAQLPVDLKLRSNNRYGFGVTIYSLLSDTERTSLKEIVHHNITNYLNATVEANQKGMDLSKRSNTVRQDLNSIVKRSLMYYRNTQQREFEGFSDVVKLKLQQVENARMSNAKFNVVRQPADSMKSADEIKADYARQLSAELEQTVFDEADNYLNLDFVKLYDSFVITNRVTEKSQTVLPLFIGYGGVYLGGSFNDLEYDSQPYAGFSFPLGRGNETHYGRTSFIIGIYLNNFKNAAGNTITGPIVDRPVFAGLGFRVYDFINFNAGMVATSTQKYTIADVKTENIQLKPFIGLNAQFNLWLGLNKK